MGVRRPRASCGEPGVTAAWQRRGSCHLCHRAHGALRDASWGRRSASSRCSAPSALPGSASAGARPRGAAEGRRNPNPARGWERSEAKALGFLLPGVTAGPWPLLQCGATVWHPLGAGPGGFSGWRSLPGDTALWAEPSLVSPLLFSPVVPEALAASASEAGAQRAAVGIW